MAKLLLKNIECTLHKATGKDKGFGDSNKPDPRLSL